MSVSMLSVAIAAQLISTSETTRYQSMTDNELFHILIQKHLIQETQLLSIIATHYGLPYQSFSSLVIDPLFERQFSVDFLIDHQLIPIYQNQDTYFFATCNPFQVNKDELEKKYQHNIALILITQSDFQSYWNKSGTIKGVSENHLLNQLIRAAIDRKASDIHFNRGEDGIWVRFRVNGRLHDIKCIEDISQTVSLIKLHSHMDISIQNLPQDGRISFFYQDRQFDIRVASLPTVYGEDFVLRIFHSNDHQPDYLKLGFSDQAVELINHCLAQPNGLILVTGPTGSGKTTTLYSFLLAIQNQKNRNIVTLEDPVETILPGIRQSQINSSIQYGFSRGLRAILRQDPDVIMIGEIRDAETAKIAIEAAYTGHLVFATLHTADCQSTLFRLVGFDVDPFLLTYSLRGIVSQKLIAKKCPYCDTFSVNNGGCKYCFDLGTLGRTVVSEVLCIDAPFYMPNLYDNVEQLIDRNSYISFESDIFEKRDRGILA